MHQVAMPANHLLQIKEKGLPPEQAAQIAQQITAGKIRMSELNGLGSMSSQEQMVSLTSTTLHAKVTSKLCVGHSILCRASRLCNTLGWLAVRLMSVA